MAKRPWAFTKTVLLSRLTAEYGEQMHQVIYVAVGARPTSLSSARDSTLGLREAGNIDETLGDAFYEERLGYINCEHDSTGLHGSEYLIFPIIFSHPANFIMVKSADYYQL